jgi:hypothetical protein
MLKTAGSSFAGCLVNHGPRKVTIAFDAGTEGERPDSVTVFSIPSTARSFRGGDVIEAVNAPTVARSNPGVGDMVRRFDSPSCTTRNRRQGTSPGRGKGFPAGCPVIAVGSS